MCLGSRGFNRRAPAAFAPSLLLLALLLLALAGCQRGPWYGITPEQFARLEEHRLRGIVLLEAGKRAEAAAEFRAMQRLRPQLAVGYLNEAACFVHEPQNSEAALAPARKGAELLPHSARPLLIEASLLQNLSRPADAAKAFERARRREPNNPRVVGALLHFVRDSGAGSSTQLYELRRQLAQLAPENLAAQVEWLQSQAERGEAVGVRTTLEAIQRIVPGMSPDTRDHLQRLQRSLAANDPRTLPETRPLANLLRGEPRYLPDQNQVFGSRQDPAVLVMRDWGAPPPAVIPPPLQSATVTWTDATKEAGLAGLRIAGLAPIAAGDLDLWPEAGRRVASGVQPHQERPDLVLGAEMAVPFTGTQAAFRSMPPAEGSPLLLDIDNDFVLDAYVARTEGDFLWRNPLQGDTRGEQFRLVRIGSAAGTRTPVAARGFGSATAVDLDQDGDLDILRAGSDTTQPALRYLRNNGDRTFTDLTGQAGLKLPSGGARQVVYADFDNDLDPDLFVARAAGPSQLFLNLRQDAFRSATEQWSILSNPGALSAAVADYNRDGLWDLAVAGEGEPRHPTGIYRNTGSSFQPEPLPLPADFQGKWVEWLDYDNDSWLDLVIAGRGGLYLLRNDAGRLSPPTTPFTGDTRWVSPVDYDVDGDLDLILVTHGNRVHVLRNEGGNSRPWLRLELNGYVTDTRNRSPGEATQSNNSYGIGTFVELLSPWDRQKVLMTRPVMHLGLGRAEKAVGVRAEWAQGTSETLLAPTPGFVATLVQRPGNSCPYLYTWDGKGWRFVKDFNWRSPLGMLQARGKPVPHALTRDWIKIPGDWLQPEGGYYRLSATEELRELSYFDMLRLLAVDHPPGTGAYVDERFPFGPPDPFRVYTTRRERRPISARSEAGKDLLPALRSVDDVYTPVPTPSLRGVCPPHELILDLGDVPDPDNVRLFLHGWLYPPTNSSNIAASQSRAVPVIHPYLQVGDGKGGWSAPDRTVGLPCGKRKTIVLDLSRRFTRGDYRVKLTTTYEIRWDAAFYTSGEAPVPLRRHEIPLLSAALSERGLSEVYYDAPDGPDLHGYDRLLTGARNPQWRPIEGAYTRLGECSPLLKHVDDQYAIIGPGDEIRLVFDSRSLPPLPPGWKRDYILISDGWTKDTDANTVTGETVAPLPFHGMKRYPYGPEERFPDTPAHRKWKQEWNTRLKTRTVGPEPPRPDWRSP